MRLQLHNSWKWKGDDWWSWSAYVKGPDLDKVKSVEYVLHPTFINPVRKVKDAASGFKMDTEGWGTFKLKAIIHLKDGTEELLTHEVVLREQPKSGNTE